MLLWYSQNHMLLLERMHEHMAVLASKSSAVRYIEHVAQQERSIPL